MRNLITVFGICVLLWGTTAPAAEKVLTEKQLDAITAGTGGEGAQQSNYDNYIANQVDDANIKNDIYSDNQDAVSVVNIPNTNIDNSVDNSQNINGRNKEVMLNGDAQKNTKAVTITNSIDSKVGSGINVHVNGSLPGGSSGGSLNNLYQSNTIINNN